MDQRSLEIAGYSGRGSDGLNNDTLGLEAPGQAQFALMAVYSFGPSIEVFLDCFALYDATDRTQSETTAYYTRLFQSEDGGGLKLWFRDQYGLDEASLILVEDESGNPRQLQDIYFIDGRMANEPASSVLLAKSRASVGRPGCIDGATVNKSLSDLNREYPAISITYTREVNPDIQEEGRELGVTLIVDVGD